MAKKALLVEFLPMTRIIVDIPDGQYVDEWVDKHVDEVVKKARGNMLKAIDEYLIGDNMAVYEDTEIPDGELSNDLLEEKKGGV